MPRAQNTMNSLINGFLEFNAVRPIDSEQYATLIYKIKEDRKVEAIKYLREVTLNEIDAELQFTDSRIDKNSAILKFCEDFAQERVILNNKLNLKVAKDLIDFLLVNIKICGV